MKLRLLRASFLPGAATIAFYCLVAPVLSIVLAVALYVALASLLVFVSDLVRDGGYGIFSTLLDLVGPIILYGPPILLVIAIWRFGRKVRTWEQNRRQRFRDELAASVLQPSDHFIPPIPDDYVLYLRPFASTGAIPVVLKVKPDDLHTTPGDKPILGATIVSEDMETVIAEAVESSMPFVALGRPGEHVGAGRIEAQESNWRDKFTRLACGAERILVVPSLHPGTRWELAQLVSNPGLLHKTMFIVPPDPTIYERLESGYQVVHYVDKFGSDIHYALPSCPRGYVPSYLHGYVPNGRVVPQDFRSEAIEFLKQLGIVVGREDDQGLGLFLHIDRDGHHVSLPFGHPSIFGGSISYAHIRNAVQQLVSPSPASNQPNASLK